MSPRTAVASRPTVAGDSSGGRADTDGPDRSSSSGRPERVLPAVALVVGLLGVLALTGVAGATLPAGTLQQDNDTAGPTVGNLTKVDDETIELEIHDDTDVDESTIDSSDFQLSAGRIENVTVVEDGSDARARIHLMDEVNLDEITVYVPAETAITDAAGNPRQGYGDVSRTVDGMDGVAPFVTEFRARPGPNGTIDVRLRLDERLAGLTVEVAGPRPDRLTLANFSQGDQPNSYEATIDPGRDGEYRVRIVDLVGPEGNDDSPRAGQNVTVDTTPPEAVAVVDLQASTGRNYTFDATRSTDRTAIANVTWAFGDGTGATGERVRHRYAPGNYTATVRVTDVRGNTGTDEMVLVAGDGNASLGPGRVPNASATVRLTGPASDADSALIDVAGVEGGQPVRIPAGSGRTVATGEAFTLESLTVWPAGNGSYRLGVQTERASAVGAAESAVGGTALGGFTVVHEVPDGALENATIALGVDRAAVDDAGGDPSEVGLYRRHDGEWEGLETAVVERTNETVRYRATSPGFSRFALVAGGDGGQPTAGDESTTATQDPPSTVPSPAGTPEGGDGGPPFGVGGLLGLLPLGLLEALLRYVGSVALAAFLLLKSLALLLGY